MSNNIPSTLLDNEFDLELYSFEDSLKKHNKAVKAFKATEAAKEEICEQTLIDPMWAWLDYEIDPKGPEGVWLGLDGDRPPIPFKVICETCGKRAGRHHGQDGMNCDLDSGVVGHGLAGTNRRSVRRFVPKKRVEVRELRDGNLVPKWNDSDYTQSIGLSSTSFLRFIR